MPRYARRRRRVLGIPSNCDFRRLALGTVEATIIAFRSTEEATIILLRRGRPVTSLGTALSTFYAHGRKIPFYLWTSRPTFPKVSVHLA